MNYHKECLRLLGEGKVTFSLVVHEFAARHPKEFLQVVAPALIKPKVIIVKINTPPGQTYSFSGEMTMREDVFDKCVKAAREEASIISAIKTIRTLTHCGLTEGKCFYEMVQRGAMFERVPTEKV